MDVIIRDVDEATGDGRMRWSKWDRVWSMGFGILPDSLSGML